MTVCFSTRAPNADYLGFEASPEAIIAAAKKAEEVGFDAIFVNDHVIVGDDTRSAPWTNLPSNDTLPGAQHACQRRRYSLLRAPRSWNGTPSALNSASFHPTPMPVISRPPDMRSNRGSKLDADHPSTGVNILRRITARPTLAKAPNRDRANHGPACTPPLVTAETIFWRCGTDGSQTLPWRGQS